MTVYDAAGNTLSFVQNEVTGLVFFGFETDDSSALIAGLKFRAYLLSPGGASDAYSIDNLVYTPGTSQAEKCCG